MTCVQTRCFASARASVRRHSRCCSAATRVRTARRPRPRRRAAKRARASSLGEGVPCTGWWKRRRRRGEEEDGPSITHTRMHNSNGRGDGGAEDVVMKLNGGMELGLSPATLSGGSDDEDFANAPPPNTDTITSSRSFFGQPLCLHPCVCHIAACLSFACARACAHTLLHSFTHPWLMRRHWTKRPE